MRSTTLQGVALVGVTLLLGAIAVVVLVPGADQYEISLYRAYPAYFWMLVVGALFAGSLVIVGSARTPGDGSWVFGLLVVLVTDGLLLLLPYVRGYRMFGRSDAMSHLGYVRDVADAGDVAGNVYPPMHLLVLAVSDATGVGPMTVALLLPAVVSLVYFASMGYVLCLLFDDRERILLGLPFVALPVLRHAHLGLRPFDLSVMLVPFLLYLFFRAQRSHAPPVRVAFVVALVAVLLYHPLTALFLIAIFSFFLAGAYLPRVGSEFASPTNLVSLTAAVFVAWYSGFLSILVRFNRIYEVFFGPDDGGESQAEAYTRTVEEASPPLLDLVRVIVFKYGIEFVLFGLGFVCLVVALALLVRSEYAFDPASVLLAGTLVAFSFGGLVFLVMDLIVPPERAFQMAKLGGVLLAGQLFYLLGYRVGWIRSRPSLGAVLWACLVAVLLVLVVTSVFSLYESPLGSESNHQVTDMEVHGTAWLAANGDGDLNHSGIGLSYHRFHHAMAGTRTDPAFEASGTPPHFNYTEHDHLGASFANDSYMTITRQGRIVYPEAFPNYRENWRYTPEDFERLERDSTTARVYDNGDYDQYLVEGTRDDATGPAGAGDVTGDGGVRDADDDADGDEGEDEDDEAETVEGDGADDDVDEANTAAADTRDDA